MASPAQYVLASGIFLVLFLFVNSKSSPCTNYFLINEPKRSTRNILAKGEKAICDSELTAGWYRFTMAKQARIPTSEPGIRHCGTLAPIWIKGTHPDTEGEERLAIACAKIDSMMKGCMYQQDVRIKNCGDFYVYYLQPTPNRCMAYCAELDNKERQGDFRSERKIRSVLGNNCDSKNNSCVIDGKCYGSNDVNPQDWCQKCIPDIRNDTWSTRNDNRPPSFLQGQEITRFGVDGESLPLKLIASDPDKRLIMFSLLNTTATSGYSLSSSGVLRVNVTTKDSQFVVSVKDECNATDTITVRLNYMPCKCKNGGQCLPNATSPRGSGQYDCQCRQGFSGSICEKSDDVCQSANCGNGTCVAGANNYTCQCNDGFKGSACDQMIHKCTSQSCFTGVQCTETLGGISCGPCPNEMTGDGKTCTALAIPGLDANATTTRASTTLAYQNITTSAATTTTIAAVTAGVASTTAAATTTSSPTTADARENSTTTASISSTAEPVLATTKAASTTTTTTTTITTTTTATTTAATTTGQVTTQPDVTTTSSITTTAAATTTTTTKPTTTTTKPTTTTTTTKAPTTRVESTTTHATTASTAEMKTTKKATEQTIKTTASEKLTPSEGNPTEGIPTNNLYVVSVVMLIQLEWRKEYSDSRSDGFKSLKNLLTVKIIQVYKEAGDTNFYNVSVTTFRPGSVIAEFQLAFKSKTSKPLEVLSSAIKNGTLYGLEVDPDSLKINEAEIQAKATPQEHGPNIVLIVILVILAVLIVVVIAVTCYIRKKNRRKMDMNKLGKDDGTPAETIPLTEKNNK